MKRAALTTVKAIVELKAIIILESIVRVITEAIAEAKTVKKMEKIFLEKCNR